MRAMVLREFRPVETGGEKPLDLVDLPVPVPSPDQVLIKVSVCGICHTEIDEIEGRLVPPKFPIVPGHEIVGRVHAVGSEVRKYRLGDRVGIAWIHSSCGRCSFCVRGDENLCDDFRATGLHAHGGYAEYTVVSEDFAGGALRLRFEAKPFLPPTSNLQPPTSPQIAEKSHSKALRFVGSLHPIQRLQSQVECLGRALMMTLGHDRYIELMR